MTLNGAHKRKTETVLYTHFIYITLYTHTPLNHRIDKPTNNQKKVHAILKLINNIDENGQQLQMVSIQANLLLMDNFNFNANCIHFALTSYCVRVAYYLKCIGMENAILPRRQSV